MKEHGADVRDGSERVHFDAGMILELIAHAPAEFTIHARNPAHDVRFGGNNLVLSQMASAPNCSDHRPRPAPGQSRGLPQFPEARADAQHPDDDRRLPGRAGRHPSVGAASRMHPRPRDADRQGLPYLFARAGAERRRHRDRPDRPRHLPRAASGRALRLHDHQHQLAAEARRADDGRHHPDVRQRPGRHRHPFHAGRRHGAGHRGRRAGPAECRSAGRDRLHPDGQERRSRRLWRLHLERRHEVGSPGLRHAGIHEGADRRRAARQTLPYPVPHLEHLCRQCGGCPGRL